jgi:hypothetical protein
MAWNSRSQLQRVDNIQNIESESDQKYLQWRILEYKKRSVQAGMKSIQETKSEMLNQKRNEHNVESRRIWKKCRQMLILQFVAISILFQI